MQYITATQWSLYVLKYATKCEPTGNIHLSAEAAAALGLHGLSEQQLKLASMAILSRPVSPAEAACIVLGIALTTLSVTVVHIACMPPKQRTQWSSADQVSIPWVERYMARQACHETMTFEQYFSTFILVHLNKPCPKAAVQEGTDALLWKVCKPDSLCVRFSNFSPQTQPEAYFYWLLLQAYPFRCEAHLDPDPALEEHSYLDVCKRYTYPTAFTSALLGCESMPCVAITSSAYLLMCGMSHVT